MRKLLLVSTLCIIFQSSFLFAGELKLDNSAVSKANESTERSNEKYQEDTSRQNQNAESSLLGRALTPLVTPSPDGHRSGNGLKIVLICTDRRIFSGFDGPVLEKSCAGLDVPTCQTNFEKELYSKYGAYTDGVCDQVAPPGATYDGRIQTMNEY